MESLDWANRSGTGLLCDRCGFVPTFIGTEFEPWDPSGG